MKRLAIFACVGVVVVLASGCYSVTWKSDVNCSVSQIADMKASLYMPEACQSATHSFRAMGSGIANRWKVSYGNRVHDFGAAYLKAGFADYEEASSPSISDGVLVSVKDVEYEVRNQAAHVSLTVEATDAAGAQLVSRTYSGSGGSGHGAVFWGGAFAQKAVIRNSTDDALHAVFKELTDDLRTALKK